MLTPSTNIDKEAENWEYKLNMMDFPTYEDYGCDGMEVCCGNCGGSRIDEQETKNILKAFIRTVRSAAIEQGRKEIINLWVSNIPNESAKQLLSNLKSKRIIK